MVAVFARGRSGKGGGAQVIVQRLVAARVRVHLVHALRRDARSRNIPCGRHGQPAAGARAHDARHPPVGRDDAERRVREARGLRADRGVGNLTTALRAVAPVERGIVRLGVAAGELAEAAGHVGVGDAVRQRVVAREAQAGGRPAAERQLQAAIALRARVNVADDRAEELARGGILQVERAAAIGVRVTVHDGYDTPAMVQGQGP